MGSWGRFFAVGVGVAALGVLSNCANGSGAYENTGDGGDDGNGVETDGSGGGGDGNTHADGGCPSGDELCGTTCVNPGKDPNNCGGCGKKCSAGLLCDNGACSASCNVDGGQETVCPGGADGGPAQPYCASLQNDPSNCGTCGKSCGTNHACQSGNCILNCPPSQTVCVSGDTCIAVGACCTTNDCTIAGETCATPGSACTCPGGQKACAANNQCIVSATCCSSTDCSISGETCSGPGGSCNCPVGQTACVASGTCIPSGNCCTNADCKIVGETCPTPGGTCACPTGFNACIASNSCIPSTACCTTADCKVTGETCPAAGGVCACNSSSKVCAVNNACIPTNTCCTSNDCLVTGENCTGPGGNCTCPNSGTVCTIASPPFNSCITAGTCCTTADCKGAGTCSGPGGSCNCPTGQTFCSANNMCIPSTECCTTADCKVTGETCSGAGGSCSCPVNQKVCGNICIGSTTCCNNGDCPPEANTTATDCPSPGGTCQLTCNTTCFDINKMYSDGCECCEDPNSTCGGTSLGTLGLGNTAKGQGKLPGASADWFTVTFNANASLSFHPSVSLAGDAGMVFDIYTNCAGGAMICGNEGGNCTGKTSWETSYTCPEVGGCTAAAQTYGHFVQSMVGTVYIKVYRASGAPTCNNFTLSVSD